MKSYFFCLLILGVVANTSYAQQDSAHSLTFSGYTEVYYAYDFNKTSHNERPSFIYNHKRVNETSINLALIRADYETQQVRSAIGLMVGSYVDYNLRNEPAGMRNIYEANVGIKLSPRQNIWLDAGVLPSHLGLATPIGKDNWTLTRSLACENTPYYETGVRVSYTGTNGRWYVAALAVNGWQRMQRTTDNSIPSIGTQITYKPSSQLLFNSSNYFGNEHTNKIQRWRLFHNLYAVYQPTPAFGIAACFDIGTQQQILSGTPATWFASYLQTRYSFAPKWSATARLEHYNDRHEFLVSTNTPNGFQTTGYSLNIDYRIVPSAVFRIEGKLYNSKDAVFTTTDEAVTRIYSGLTTVLAVSF
jgi:hypothetical protein